jgi:hypothetical protein
MKKLKVNQKVLKNIKERHPNNPDVVIIKSKDLEYFIQEIIY